jgi:hypothetical protein
MDAAEQDVHQTLEYRGDATIAGLLPFGLMLCFLASLVLALDDRPEPAVIAAVCVVAPAGIGLIAAALWRRRRRGKPLFVLSPRGVHFRRGPEYVLVPWREIQGIDSVDVSSWNFSIGRPGTITFRDVTVILLPREFYESHILLPFWRRGPALARHVHPERRDDPVCLASRGGIGRGAGAARGGRGPLACVPRPAGIPDGGRPTDQRSACMARRRGHRCGLSRRPGSRSASRGRCRRGTP